MRDKYCCVCIYLRLAAPGDMGVEVAAGSGLALACSGILVGEAEPVLVLISPMLERFMLGIPDPDDVKWSSGCIVCKLGEYLCI